MLTDGADGTTVIGHPGNADQFNGSFGNGVDAIQESDPIPAVPAVNAYVDVTVPGTTSGLRITILPFEAVGSIPANPGGVAGNAYIFAVLYLAPSGDSSVNVSSAGVVRLQINGVDTLQELVDDIASVSATVELLPGSDGTVVFAQTGLASQFDMNFAHGADAIQDKPRDPLVATIDAPNRYIRLEALIDDSRNDIDLVLEAASYTINNVLEILGRNHLAIRGDPDSPLLSSVFPEAEGNTVDYPFDTGTDHEPITWHVDEAAKTIRLDYDSTDTFGELVATSEAQVANDITVTLIEGTSDEQTALPPPLASAAFVLGHPFGGTEFIDTVADTPPIENFALGTRFVAEDSGIEQIIVELGHSGLPATYDQADYVATNFRGAFLNAASVFVDPAGEFTSADDANYLGRLSEANPAGAPGRYYFYTLGNSWRHYLSGAWTGYIGDVDDLLPANYVWMARTIGLNFSRNGDYVDVAEAVQTFFTDTGREPVSGETYVFHNTTTGLIETIELTADSASAPSALNQWAFFFEEAADGYGHTYISEAHNGAFRWAIVDDISMLGLPSLYAWLTPTGIREGRGVFADYEAAREYLEGIHYDSRYTYLYADRDLVEVRALSNRVVSQPATLRKSYLKVPATPGLGPEQNVFGTSTTTNRAAARALLDTYATANATWLASYNGDLNFLVQLKWDDGEALLRRNIAGTNWEDATNLVIGPRGALGAQARFVISVFRNATAAPTTPVGGSYEIETGVLTPPPNWGIAPAVPGTGENGYESQAIINPLVDSGSVTPAWSTPVEPVEENAEQAALAAQAAAEAAQAAAEAARTDAQTAETGAQTAETSAQTAETNAETAETNAETAQTAAETAQGRAEAAQSGAETALASSGAALAFNDLWSGDLLLSAANQWHALGTEPVPANATWLLWNGGTLTAGTNDGPAALWTWINAADWRALTADTVGSTPGDGTGMLFADWCASDIGDGTPDFTPSRCGHWANGGGHSAAHGAADRRELFWCAAHVHHPGSGDARWWWRWWTCIS